MGAVELELHWLLISASDAGVWLVARPGYSNSKETAAVSIEWDDIWDLGNVERTKIFFLFRKLEHSSSDVQATG